MRHPNHKRTWPSFRIQRLPFNQEGFTFIEIIVALLMLGILTAVFSMGLVAAVQSYDFSRTNTHIAQKTQMAMARMTRELMELIDIASISSDGEDTYIIYERLVEETPPSAMRFGIHHHQADGMVRLYTDLSSAQISLGVNTIGQGDVLIDGVDNLSLAYWAGTTTWTLNTVENNVQLLSNIQLTMTLERPDKPDQTQAFETTIHLRNNNNFGGEAPTASPASREDYTCFIRSLIEGSRL